MCSRTTSKVSAAPPSSPGRQAGSPERPAPNGMSLSMRSDPGLHAQLLVLSFGGGLSLGAAPTDPSCPADQVLAVPETCPLGARVGIGTLELAAVRADFTAYNAPGGGGG